MKRFRGIILSTSNVNAIPSGALYTCKFKIASGASRSALLDNLNIGASDPAGTALTAEGDDGQIQIGGVVEPTPTPTEEEEECPTPVAGGAVVQIGSANIEPGTATVAIPVSMVTSDASIAGVQNDIIFDPAIVNLSKAGDCVINSAIGDKLTECEEDPPTAPCKQLQRNLADCPAAAGCPSGSEGLRRFRGIILSTSNVNVIPDGVLYTCTFTVTGGEGQTAVLQNLNFGSSDPAGSAKTTGGCDGKVKIGGVAQPTNTPTHTVIPPTNTPAVNTPTSTVTPVINTPTRTAPPAPTRTNTRPPSTGDDDDGCQIAAPGQAGTGWLLLIPLAGLFWLRRRTR